MGEGVSGSPCLSRTHPDRATRKRSRWLALPGRQPPYFYPRFKPHAGRLVVWWVTTCKSLLLYVFVDFYNLLPSMDDALGCTCVAGSYATQVKYPR
jgi:hypothetical protein